MERVAIVAGVWFMFWMMFGAVLGGLSGGAHGGVQNGIYFGAFDGAWLALLTSFAWPWILPERIKSVDGGETPVMAGRLVKNGLVVIPADPDLIRGVPAACRRLLAFRKSSASPMGVDASVLQSKAPPS